MGSDSSSSSSSTTSNTTNNIQDAYKQYNISTAGEGADISGEMGIIANNSNVSSFKDASFAGRNRIVAGGDATIFGDKTSSIVISGSGSASGSATGGGGGSMGVGFPKIPVWGWLLIAFGVGYFLIFRRSL